MKQNQFGLGEKFIETPSLLIKKNIITWDNTMIQMSNISYISAADIATIRFPILAALFILVGFFLVESNAFLAFVPLAIGGVWLYFWYNENEKRKQGAILTIRMNSGHNLYFTFENKQFLLQVLQVMERIITDGNDSSQVSINITDCTISDNARVLDNLSI